MKRSAYSSLAWRKQGSQESVNEFASAIQRLVLRSFPSNMNDDIIDMAAREHFLMGLRPNLLSRVTMADPKTFADAIRIALRKEDLVETKNVSRINAIVSQPSQFNEVIGLLTKLLENKNDSNRKFNRGRVDGFQHDCVLGTDFLSSLGISIDMSTWSLKWNSETTFLSTDPPDLYGDVSLLERVEISPRSEVFLVLPISPECPIGLFEMNDSLCQSSNIYAARSLVQPQQGEIPARLVNPNTHVAILEPETMIGRVKLVTDIQRSKADVAQDNNVINSIKLPVENRSEKEQIKLRDVLSPFERVCVDVFGPLPTSDLGNRYVVVFTDSLTKWPETFAIRSTGAKVIAQLFVEEIICRHGASHTLLSDRDGPRPIVAKLAKWKDKERILKKAREKTRWNKISGGFVMAHNDQEGRTST
eukprot:gene10167-18835_t